MKNKSKIWRWWDAVLVVLALVAITVPVGATHITEPQRPIVETSLRIYKYPDFAGTAVDCSTGTFVYRFPAARIESFVTPLPGWVDRQAPSEHFRVRTQVTGTRADGRNGLLWDAQWQHQNTRPHPIKPSPEVQQSNTYGMVDGPAQVLVEVVGDESGNVFTNVCNFIVDVP